jgi:uncharacterized protein (UPF0147 family)
MAAAEQYIDRLGHEDKQLVDLVTAALVDPNIHTDARMRLHEEITELLRGAHHDAHRDGAAVEPRPAAQAPPERSPVDSDGVLRLLTEVLVDPNLHTDTRMRLHDQISRLVRDADVLA